MTIRINSGVAAGGVPNLTFVQAHDTITLGGGQAWTIPAGPKIINPGQYSQLEVYDSNTNLWRQAQYPLTSAFYVDSDGANFRMINRTGCPTGALVTTQGTGYTNGIGVATAVSSAGGSKWLVITGGAINTTVTVTTAGAYNYPPTLIFSAPPNGGVRASGIAVMSGTAISSVTVTNQGAGYTAAPTVQVIPDPRETLAGGGVLTVNATLAGSGAVTAVLCTEPGVAQTATPTLTFSGGGGTGAAATVLMNYTVTGFTVSAGGAGYGNALAFMIRSISGISTATIVSSPTAPILQTGVAFSREAIIAGTSTAGGAITATGATIVDAGWGFQQAPSLIVLAAGAIPTTIGTATATVGGTTDTILVQRL